MPSPISLFESLMPSFTRDRLERITAQLHQAIIAVITVIPSENHIKWLLPNILRSLTMWKSRPGSFAEMAYEWCSVICEHYLDLEAKSGMGRTLLFLSLEIGFRHLDFRTQDNADIELDHTEHHRQMVDVVFKHGSDEVIADFLHTWTSGCSHFGSPHDSLHTCASHLAELKRLQSFSPRLRHLLISSIGHINHRRFSEQVGGESLIDLLDHLHVRFEDVKSHDHWAEFLLSVIQSVEGTRNLSYSHWEVMVELIGSKGRGFLHYMVYNPLVIGSLEDTGEWDRLGCWIAVVWAIWGPNEAANLESATLSLFHRQPGTFQKLAQRIEILQRSGPKIEPFRILCEQRNLDVAGPHSP